MQSSLEVVLALLLAHLLGDFPFQTDWMVAGKLRGDWRAYAAHLGIHLAVTLAALLLFTAVPLGRPITLLAVVLLLIGHASLDLGKSALLRHRVGWDGSVLFLGDQLLHLAIVAAAATLLPEVTLEPASLAESWLTLRFRMLVEAVVLVAFVFPTGYLIRYLLKPLSDALPAATDDQPEGLANAGLVLGWIERALLIFAFAEASMTAIGLIVGAKSIARFPEFKSRAFAEYFLIGTLLSVAVAGIGAVVLRAARAALTGG